MVIIDKEKCILCGMCVKDCFPENLFIEENKVHVKGSCMQCGHCIAICPANAVSIDDYPMEEVKEYTKEEFFISSENLLNFIKFRRSIRHFKNKAISKELLEKVIEAGRYSPTGANRQDITYTVIQDSLGEFKPIVWESLYQLALKNTDENGLVAVYAKKWIEMYQNYKKNQGDYLFFQAPVMIVVSALLPLNGALAASKIELMANTFGLGVLFSGFIETAIKDNEEIKKFLGVGKKEIVACMLMGYPNIIFKRTAPRKKTQIRWK